MAETTVILTEELAEQLERVTAVGGYTSPVEALRAALAALEDDTAHLTASDSHGRVEDWLRHEVGPRLDRLDTGQDHAISANALRARLAQE